MIDKLIDHLQNLGIGALAPAVGAVIILVIGLLFLKVVIKIVSKTFEKSDRLDPSVEKLIVTVLRLGGCAVLVLICAEILSIPTTSLITLLGTFGLALSLSLQSTVENIASGIFIMVSKPFLTGHWISAGGSEGAVESIGLTHTVLRTGTNQLISIPNGKIAAETVVNYSTEKTRRLDMDWGVSYSADTDKAKALIAEVVAADERVLLDPAPFIRVWEVSEYSVKIKVRVWANSSDYWEVRSCLTENIKKAFDQNGITIPIKTVAVVNEK